jgi:hypothetical protein
MMTFRTTALAIIVAVATATAVLSAQSKSAAAEGLEKLKALHGDWIDVDGAFGRKGAVAITYRVTSGGKTVIETFPVNTPEEMVTVYHLDGNDLVLTHYCSGGTQPRMRSQGLVGNSVAFDFVGGANIDPAKTSHMHSVRIEFVSADEIKGTWQNWSNGKADDDHLAAFRAIRKK